MDASRLLTCLDTQYLLMWSAIIAAPADANVPTCPDWTVADLAEHTAEVYRHKATTIRLGDFPKPWPPEASERPERPEASPADDLTSAFAELIRELSERAPTDPARTWHEPDQTVGFWLRRMAHETVIHRIDAELAAGREVSKIDDDLALDGVDEVLNLYCAYRGTVWRDECGDLLDDPDARPITVQAGQSRWVVRTTKAGLQIAEADAQTAAQSAASASGQPGSMLRWLWNRAADDTVALTGDEALLGKFRALRMAATG